MYAVDWEEKFLEDNRERMRFCNNVRFIQHDMNSSALNDVKVSAIYMIDVIEHVDPKGEARFMENLLASYEDKDNAVMIIGTPNLTAAQYASKQSESVHINLKTQKDLKTLLDRYFNNTFMFGMNDEVLHTGYSAMCHYIWGMGVGLNGYK